MFHSFFQRLNRRAFALLLMTALLGLTNFAHAHEYKAGSLEIDHPWSRATPNGAKVAGGYLKIINHGNEADRLVSVSSELSGKAEIHTMSVENGVMKMRHLMDGVEIPAGKTIEFKPGAYHIMFMNITAPVKAETKFKGKLVFEKAGTVDVEFAVEAMGAQTPEHNQHQDKHQH